MRLRADCGIGFGAAPVAGEVWLFIAPFGAGMLALEQCRKAIARLVGRQSRPCH